MPAPIGYITSRGFIGVAPETTIGTPVAASSYVQLLDESIAREPGIVLEKLLRGSRDTAFVPVLGEQSIKGKIDTPLYVDQGLALLAAAIGKDAYQTGGASSGGVAMPALAAGALTVSLTAQTTPAIAVGDYIEFRQATGAGSGTNLSEIHKVTAVTGTGPYVITWTDQATVNTYTSAGQAYRIAAATAVFTHQLLGDQPNAGSYKTLTLEKNLGGLTSLQFAGATVSKASFTLDTKGAAKVGYDVSALAEAQIAGTVPTYGTSAPLALANFAASLFGASDTSVQSFSLDVDQMAKEFYTFNGGNLPSLVAPVERKVSGKFTNLVQSIGYYNDMAAGTTGAAVLTLTQGANSIVFTLPKIVITKLGVPLKIGTLLLYDVTFEAPYDDASGYSIQATVTNSKYLPLV